MQKLKWYLTFSANAVGIDWLQGKQVAQRYKSLGVRLFHRYDIPVVW